MIPQGKAGHEQIGMDNVPRVQYYIQSGCAVPILHPL